jgi:hypothetical protein
MLSWGRYSEIGEDEPPQRAVTLLSSPKDQPRAKAISREVTGSDRGPPYRPHPRNGMRAARIALL